ncbi:hypothetical protein AB0E81_10460 [Streptomyces sp. NPDC033538]|uniref:hypothetical protein n=1 Tax=Streptomyces sp. NPDC033538 TaxID=3155367 RepID=UPI0033C97149
MPLPPLEHDRRYGELDQVIRAYAGQRAPTTHRSERVRLTAYLRVTWHTPLRDQDLTAAGLGQAA